MEQKAIYKISTEGDVEGRSMQILGYATGEKKDIEEYYLLQKTYSLKIEAINVIHIDSSVIQRKNDLLYEKRLLEKKLRIIETELKNL